MGLQAVCRKPNTTKKTPGYEVRPYLLAGLTINRANQVRALDTTYLDEESLCLPDDRGPAPAERF